MCSPNKKHKERHELQINFYLSPRSVLLNGTTTAMADVRRHRGAVDFSRARSALRSRVSVAFVGGKGDQTPANSGDWRKTTLSNLKQLIVDK